ncbi:MAG TPA: hypothetical protein VFS43_05910 [Polyangiaceae bacterium]|nr:hypothetical protein [Polyangiaceae bacterium]
MTEGREPRPRPELERRGRGARVDGAPSARAFGPFVGALGRVLGVSSGALGRVLGALAGGAGACSAL